jgi:hypothetical protein
LTDQNTFFISSILTSQNNFSLEYYLLFSSLRDSNRFLHNAVLPVQSVNCGEEDLSRYSFLDRLIVAFCCISIVPSGYSSDLRQLESHPVPTSHASLVPKPQVPFGFCQIHSLVCTSSSQELQTCLSMDFYILKSTLVHLVEALLRVNLRRPGLE